MRSYIRLLDGEVICSPSLDGFSARAPKHSDGLAADDEKPGFAYAGDTGYAHHNAITLRNFKDVFLFVEGRQGAGGTLSSVIHARPPARLVRWRAGGGG